MYQTALIWSDGAEDGGTPIIDYRILYAAGSNDFTVLRQGILTKSYIATGLNTGMTYTYRVQARNVQGFSDFSTDQVIVTADLPD